jgi:SagB-type dehydrogenase family enzyme
MLEQDDTRSLALLFHLNSGPWLNAEASSETYPVEVKEMPDAPLRVPLTRSREPGGLSDLIGRRVSCREYRSETLALDDLGALLAASYGLGRPFAFGGLEMQTRAVPSAGALYPLELYLVLRGVGSLADGIYHYGVLDHTLEQVRLGIDERELAGAVIAAPLVANAGALVFITAVFDRTLRKYGARGYRYILFEAGHVAQNLCLLATERGLASLCVGGFVDVRINEVLALDPAAEGAVYCVAIGHAASEEIATG